MHARFAVDVKLIMNNNTNDDEFLQRYNESQLKFGHWFFHSRIVLMAGDVRKPLLVGRDAGGRRPETLLDNHLANFSRQGDGNTADRVHVWE